MNDEMVQECTVPTLCVLQKKHSPNITVNKKLMYKKIAYIFKLYKI